MRPNVDPPEGRKPIEWKLLTDLPVESADQVIEKMAWYATRWKIELFFKILKSGCNAEKLKLRTAERLVNLIAIFCILSWRIFWMTMLNRALPDENPECALTPAEIGVIDQIATRAGRTPAQSPKLTGLPLRDRTARRISGTEPRPSSRQHDQCGAVGLA